jgi:hypothetical protein
VAVLVLLGTSQGETCISYGNCCDTSKHVLKQSYSAQNMLHCAVFISLAGFPLRGSYFWMFILHSQICLTSAYIRIYGPKRDEVTGGWRKLRNEEFHNLRSSAKYN